MVAEPDAGVTAQIARAVHDHGGEITGVIPEFLKAQERMFADADEVIVTADMHERKAGTSGCTTGMSCGGMR